MNTVWVQPLFESLVIFAWCLLTTVLPGTSPEAVVAERAEHTLKNVSRAIAKRRTAECLEYFAEPLHDTVKARIDSMPAKVGIVSDVKFEIVHAGSHEATLRIKLLMQSICYQHRGYQDTIEHAEVTIAPRTESGDGRFYSQPASDPEEMLWEITKWETEKVVPYERYKDR